MHDFNKVFIVHFGKYRGKIYESVLEEDMDYCRWVRKTAVTSNTCGPVLKDLAKWLGEQDMSMTPPASGEPKQGAWSSEPGVGNDVTILHTGSEWRLLTFDEGWPRWPGAENSRSRKCTQHPGAATTLSSMEFETRKCWACPVHSTLGRQTELKKT
eukprot:NODE_13688_length_1152_cov_2.435122.p2 GENE.NODE_13688_length_1152_cov_2.435122~~NODE_13688_length_1152_cov_2.435122.p2  ORF type:complete len:156 (+),score=11.27 NODE_13688_length_1152_cov_2.435122:154-621(+)